MTSTEKVATAAQLQQNSRVQMAQVIAGLVSGRSVSDIAETTEVPRSRISRWFTEQNAEFMEMLAEVEDLVVEHLRSELVAEVAASIDRLAPKAVLVLQEILESDLSKNTERITAANSILRFSKMGNQEKGTAKPGAETLLRNRKKSEEHGRSPADGD